MSELEADQLARELSIDPARSILLQAPAGSGKTTVLTQRLLSLLGIADEPEQILAITFTRKAAAEMRSRVLKALHAAASGASADQLDATSLQLANAVLARSRALNWGLLEQPGRLRIQTIDSFNFWLASQLPIASRAGAQLSVADRPQEAYRRAARKTLTAADADPALSEDIGLLFERLDNRWDHFEMLLAQMLERRGHWLRYVAGQHGTELVARIRESLEHITSDALTRACRVIGPALRSQAGCLPKIAALSADPACLAAWQQLASFLLTETGGWRARLGASVDALFAHSRAKDDLKDCIDAWRKLPGAEEILRELARLPKGLSAGDERAIGALARVLSFAAAQLLIEFSARGEVDHTAIAGAARAALAEAGEPTDLALRTGLALRHILVDEFQDTSIGQFALLESLTVAWEEGDARTLFVVGDPMQSIYLFREAEVGLFLKARDHGIGQVRLQALKLTRNFRSAPVLINWANTTFSHIFPTQDDLRASAVAFTPSIAARANDPQACIELTRYAESDFESEANGIAQRILMLRKRDAKASIAILVASRTHAVPVMAALETHRVPAVGVKLVPLRELPVVSDLVALLRSLYDFADRTAWLSVLRAPWCGVSLATLTQLSPRGTAALPWESLANEALLASCEAGDAQRLRRVRGVLDAALATLGELPVARWLEAAWLRLEAMDAYAPADLAHARAFLDVLAERDARGEWRGPRDLELMLGELYAEPSAGLDNPVEVMTIHGAKGLEFDHVFLPALGRPPGTEREPLLNWLDLPRAQGDSDLIMAPVTTVGEDGGQLKQLLGRLIRERLQFERKRLLYVAATRARRSLHLSAAPKVSASGVVQPRPSSLLAHLWPAAGAEFVLADAGQASLDFAQTPPVRSIRRLRADRAARILPDTLAAARLPIERRALGMVEFSWAGETLRHIGTVVHANLEAWAAAAALPQMANIEAASALYSQQLTRSGVPADELEEATVTVKEALANTLNDPRGRWIFEPTHRDSASELALTGIAAGRLISASIDRSFIDAENTRWVIDYKTSRHRGGHLEAFLSSELDRYRAQLENYIALARALGPETVRAALYFPLLGVFRELAPARQA